MFVLLQNLGFTGHFIEVHISQIPAGKYQVIHMCEASEVTNEWLAVVGAFTQADMTHFG